MFVWMIQMRDGSDDGKHCEGMARAHARKRQMRAGRTDHRPRWRATKETRQR